MPTLAPASSFYGEKKSHPAKKPVKQNSDKKPKRRIPAAAAAVSQLEKNHDDVGMDRLVEMSQKYDDEYAQMLNEEDLRRLEIPDVHPTQCIDSIELQESHSAACDDTIEPDLSGGGLLVAKASFEA